MSAEDWERFMLLKKSKCFDKHCFQFLNNIDVQKLNNVLQYHMSLFPRTEEDIVFDVGTNAGSFVKVLTHNKFDKNIHCFEPHPVLSKCTKLIYNNVNMNNICLSNKDTNTDFYICEWSLGLSSIIKRPVFDTLEKNGQAIKKTCVPCLKLDTYCNNNNIDDIYFIKIDVEGAEKMVFEGSLDMLKEKKIKGGLFEAGKTTLKDAGTSCEEVANILIEKGYKIVKTLSPNDWYFHI